jgi:SpoVK/Ycf46/Vps4 family AAA+-type ATPase
VAIFCESPGDFVDGVAQFRTVEPDRPVVCIFEDIDAMVSRHGSGDLLHWLDGNSQIDRSVNIATTNFPERLDRRLTARPRRFDRLIRIDAPDGRSRGAYFERKLPELSTDERQRWVELSEGLTFAALAELIISVCCLENGLEESAALLKELDCHKPSAEEYDELDMDDEEEGDGLWSPGEVKRKRRNSEVPF